MSFNLLGKDVEAFFANSPLAGATKGAATSPQRDAALARVAQWAGTGAKSPWGTVDRKTFADNLSRTLRNPVSLNQHDTNLCGVAVACKIAAEYIPGKYAEMAMSIYDNGTYQNYAANPESLNAKQFNGLLASDFIVMGTLRHSLNSGLNAYDATKDEWGISGFSWPDDPGKILRSLGMRETTREYDVPAKLMHLFKAKQNEDAVLAAVNTDYFMKGTPGTTLASFLPTLKLNMSDHFIELTSIAPITAQKMKVGWWSWGKQMTELEMTPERFESSVWVLRSFNRG